MPDYASDLKKAEVLLKQTIKGYGIDNDNQEDDASEPLSKLKTQVYKYVLESKTGKKYFLHLLMLFHEILNDPNVKKVTKKQSPLHFPSQNIKPCLIFSGPRFSPRK